MFNRYTSLYLAVILLTTLQFLETSMVAFASVPIRGEIQASPEEYSLVAALYACIAVIAIANVRWFVERLGWRNYVLATIAIYVVGAAICSVSSDLHMFMIGRVVMAMGGSTFMTISRILANVPPGPGRGTGISFFATGVALGTAGAPWVAAMAVTHDHWQAIFWVLMGGAVVVGLLTLAYAPKDPLPSDQWASNSSAFVLLLALMSFFILYLLQRSYYDFYSEGGILVVFVLLGLAALLALFHVERQRDKPLLRLNEIISTRYVAGIALFCFSYLLIGANNYVQPQFLSTGLGYAWETIGKFQALAMISTLLTWLVMRRLILKYPSPIKYWLFGFGTLAGHGWILSSLSPVVDMWTHVVPALALSGCFTVAGMGMTAVQTFRDLGNHDVLFAHAYQFKSMLGQIATAMGTAVATIFLQWRQTVQYGNLNIHLNFSDPLFAQSLQGLTAYFSLTHESGAAASMAFAQQSQAVSQQALLVAGIEYYWAIFLIAVAAAAFTAVQRVFR